MEIKGNNMVDHPSHYNQGGIECIDAMIAAKGIDKVMAFCECNALKYTWRLGDKDNATQDAKKAQWYLSKYVELEQQKCKQVAESSIPTEEQGL